MGYNTDFYDWALKNADLLRKGKLDEIDVENIAEEILKNGGSMSYNTDFYDWALKNADLLRKGKLDEIDVENIAEEIESMGKSHKRSLLSHLSVLIAHLLKWKFQPEKKSKSWKLTIENQRLEIEDLLEESPSLKREISGKFNQAYKKALIIASAQTGIDIKEFPKECPFSIEECLNYNFLSE